MQRDPAKFWNPYLAGVALGLVLLSAYAVMGKGIGASGASYRVGVAAVQAVAPAHAATAPGLKGAVAHGSPLDDWLVFEVLGVALGGVVGAYTSGRLGREVLRGPRISAAARIGMALAGGLLMGFAAKPISAPPATASPSRAAPEMPGPFRISRESRPAVYEATSPPSATPSTSNTSQSSSGEPCCAALCRPGADATCAGATACTAATPSR